MTSLLVIVLEVGGGVLVVKRPDGCFLLWSVMVCSDILSYLLMVFVVRVGIDYRNWSLTSLRSVEMSGENNVL